MEFTFVSLENSFAMATFRGAARSLKFAKSALHTYLIERIE